MAKRKKRIKNHVGEIYAINPKHVVHNKSNYESTKGSNARNKRLVMVGVEKSAKKVQISNLTTKANQTHIKQKQRVKLAETYPNKLSFVDTNTISKSKLTKKHFKIGEPPLTRVQKKVKQKDIIEYQKARKYRGR